MKGDRIFRTEVFTCTDEMKKQIGDVICQLTAPFVFEVLKVEEEDTCHYILTCRVTGKATEIGRKMIEESKGEE